MLNLNASSKISSMIETACISTTGRGQGQDILFQAMAYSLENAANEFALFSRSHSAKRAGKIHMPHCPLPVRWK